MRWFKFLVILGIIAFAAYYVTASNMDESKTFTYQKEVSYPLEKVFPQFNNLQNYKSWNSFFKNQNNFRYAYFSPYEGQDGGMTYYNEDNEREGDIFIKYSSANKAIRYFWFKSDDHFPTVIEVKFKKISPVKTSLSYRIMTPKTSVLSRPFNRIITDDFSGDVDGSIANLSNVLGNKVSRENEISSLKFDSVMVESRPAEILLGTNISATTKNDGLIKNIYLNYNKVKNFLETDLQKESDEYGLPVLVTDPNDLKSKDVSYFYGFALSKKVNVTDNNFTYKYLSARKYLIIYYRGDYKNRLKDLQKLQSEAKTKEIRTGQLHETFLVPPSENGSQTLKIALEIL